MGKFGLVIVNDFYFKWARLTPFETDTKLLIRVNPSVI